MLILKLEVSAGTSRRIAVRDAIKISTVLDCIVEFNHNRNSVSVYKDNLSVTTLGIIKSINPTDWLENRDD